MEKIGKKERTLDLMEEMIRFEEAIWDSAEERLKIYKDTPFFPSLLKQEDLKELVLLFERDPSMKVVSLEKEIHKADAPKGMLLELHYRIENEEFYFEDTLTLSMDSCVSEKGSSVEIFKYRRFLREKIGKAYEEWALRKFFQ